MPLTTREKWAIGGTLVAVAAAVTVGVVVSKSASAGATNTPPPPQPIGNKNVNPGQIVQKQPPPPQQLPPGGKTPAHRGLNPNAYNQAQPPGPPQASNDPQTFNVIAGGTYQTTPAPNGTLLTVNMPGRGEQVAVGPGIKIGSQALTGRQFFAILDGSAGELSFKWDVPNGGMASATLNIVGV